MQQVLFYQLPQHSMEKLPLMVEPALLQEDLFTVLQITHQLLAKVVLLINLRVLVRVLSTQVYLRFQQTQRIITRHMQRTLLVPAMEVLFHLQR